MLCTHLTLQFNLVQILQEGGAPPFARPEYLGQVLSFQQKVSGMASRATLASYSLALPDQYHSPLRKSCVR
jgi:hypothetical protein